ncbi:uncharacterized protein [Rutidosis leptorrhynchoides]|uniref:uncharacterized protein isoform X2 n=1 Tax=Rutidosis leptorrhynchoides TaxID=125765 RepID=UPI003A9981FF
MIFRLHQLYALQSSSLRHNWRPYELEERCNKLRVNQETTEVENEMSVQVDSGNYDADVADDRAMLKQVWVTKPQLRSGGRGKLEEEEEG